MRRLTAAAAALSLTLVIPAVANAQPTPGSSSTSSSALSASQAKALSTGVTHRVIVVFKNQLGQLPASRAHVSARRHAVAQIQKPVRADLTSTKARNVRSYTTINAVAATVSAGEQKRLAASPDVAEVVPDQIIHLASPVKAAATPTAPTVSPVPGSCPAPSAAPLLTPEALGTMHVESTDPSAKTARSLGITGAGTKVGFIADGLDINNTDFIRPDGSHVFVDYKDFSGEGTAVPTGGEEAFGDASSIAAQGRNTYDISKYSAIGLNQPCNIRVEGVAPGASLVGLSIFGQEDAGFNSSFLQAIDYAVSVDHVNVLNESLGNNYYPDDQASLDIIKQANDAAVAAGTTVTTSSGDAGITGTVGTPATDPHVIAVGASTTYQLPTQLGYGGAQFGVTGWLNDNISGLSSSGFEQDGRVIDVVAPGELNWALCSTDTAKYDECTDFRGNPSPVIEFGGTSESAPLTAGVAALVDQAYAKTHGGALPSPALVKQFITSTADDIKAPGQLQGAGRVDAYRAVLAAEQYKAAGSTPGTVLESTTQFTSVGNAGTSRTFAETLTNQGSSATTVKVGSRTLGAYKPVDTTSVELSDASSPHSVDYQGFNDNYEVVHFAVPSGTDRLDASIAFQGATSDLAARVRLSLIDPHGRLADYSLPQGVGNYGDAEVAEPTGGLWTAYIWSRGSKDGGTTGPVVFGANVARYQGFGKVSASSVTIPAHASRTVDLTVARPRTPGDVAGSLVITPAGQQAQTVPIALRTLVPSKAGTFSGVLTGGNGRASFTGVTDYYEVDVVKGSSGLTTSLKLADNPNNQAYVWLVDPSGQAQAFQSNGVVTSDSSGHLTYTNTLGATAHALAPVTGRWTIIVTFAPTVSGTALREPFTMSVNETAEKVTATGVPHGQSASVNNPAVVQVKVTNHSAAPEAYFIDGRTTSSTRYRLAPLTGASTTVPLNVTRNIPEYLVPSQTSELDATAGTTGSEPIQFDMSAPTGDPDVASGQGPTVSAGLLGSPVTAGAWAIVPTTVGPFGPTGATPENVTTTLTATTRAFDPAVTSQYGDLWQAALGGDITVSPIVVQPGKSATIPVTISPTGTPGTKVSGTIYLDDDSLYSLYGGLAPNANTVAAVPYSYTVGRD